MKNRRFIDAYIYVSIKNYFIKMMVQIGAENDIVILISAYLLT